MHPALLDYYNRELGHLRDMGAEFARAFPKVAARLGMEGMEVADPYVERLMEGFAFIAARVQLKLDAEFPRFTQHLLDMVYPDYLAPIPSFAVAALQPNLADSGLVHGMTVPRGSILHSAVPRGQQTSCEFRTAHAVTLYPIELTQAAYFTHAADLSAPWPSRSGLRLRLACPAGLAFAQVDCESLNFHFTAADDLAIPLYELILARCVGAVVVEDGKLLGTLERGCILESGFDEEQALLPCGKRSFSGYRLLREYFAFPQRFLFFDVHGLGPALHAARGNTVDLVLLFDRHEPRLDGMIDAASFALYATPLVNLLERRADRVPVTEGEHEHHLVIDRTRPLDYEVFSVTRVRGFGSGDAAEVEFQPFYASPGPAATMRPAYFTTRRERRLPSARQLQSGARSGYAGSEVFLSLVDATEAPYPETIRQLAVDVLATNRDLPLLLPVAAPQPLTLDASLPVSRVALLRGPTHPRPGAAEGDYAWRLVRHLSLNYLSLIEEADTGNNGSALRELLALYVDADDPGTRKHVEAILSVASTPVIRRLPIPGPIAFGRGIAIDLHVDERQLAGSGAFLLGSVLEKFFARHVSINAFTQTTLRSSSRAEVFRWPARIGNKPLT